MVLKVGKNVYVPIDNVNVLMEYKSRNSKLVLQNAKENKNWIDATGGKATKSLVVLKDKSVITVAVTVETLVLRITNIHDESKKDNINKVI